ncbi:N-carbamoyl-L-amino-acid hydrolase, partial [Teratosphaeria destructans]
MNATVLRASRAVKYPFKQQTRCYASALKSPAAQRLTINSERLWHDIHHTAQWSAPNATTSAGGLSRLSGTIYDKHARDWFAAQVESLGAKTYTVNSVGAQFATFSGENASLPPIAMGSHLDSVATGGRFDGPLGVLGALEVVRSFQEQGIKTHAPLAVINWTNEEGARFFPPLGSSVVYAGQSTVDSAHASLALNNSGETLGSALAEIGYIGSGPNTFTEFPLSAHFEIHVEQQTSLEQANKPVGWVESWQGISVFKVTFQGEDGHANTYAMANRKDSLVAAAHLITGLDALAAADPATRTTVTALHTSPTGTCNIQSLTTLTYCLMAPTNSLLASLA